MRHDLYQELYEVEDRHWWHQHKRKVVYKLINVFTQRGKVLDIGAGTGKILQELKQKGWQVEGLESAEKAIQFCKKRGIETKFIDIQNQNFPFANESFDLVIILDVLEHLDDEKKVISEIERVLKPAGVVIVTAPAYPKLYSYWDKMVRHKRRYSQESLKRLFGRETFHLEYLSYFFLLHLLPAIIMRVIKSRKKTSRVISDFQCIPFSPLSTSGLEAYAKVEEFLVPKVRLPFGLSLVLVARKI